MTQDEIKEGLNHFMDSFGNFLDKYEEANLEWIGITLLQIIYKAVEGLKGLIENPEEKEITWETPFVELRYPVLANWKKVEPCYFRLTAEDLKSEDKLKEKFAEGFITVKEVFILRAITKEILIVIKKGKGFYKLPLDVDKKLDKLSKEERLKRIEKILKPITKPTRLKLYDVSLAGKKRAKAFLVFQFNPCILNVDKKLAYYPIVIGLEFTGIQPKDLDKETRDNLLGDILKGAEQAIPEENLGFLTSLRPELTIKPVTKEAIKYPIVKIDRTTEQDLFPLLLHKDIFKNYSSLPTRETLLEAEQKRLNKTVLNFDDERAALAKAGEYRWGNVVVRDYGDHAIGFSCQLYLDYIQQAENILKEAQKEPYLYDEDNKKIEGGLKQVSLYRMAHRLAHLTLAEVYSQKKAKGLTIQKKDAVKLLGHTTEEKQVYQDIKESYKNLMFCSFQRWNFSYTGTQKKQERVRDHTIGTFIYNLREDAKSYTLDVNEKFVGCAYNLIQDTLTPKKKRGEIFSRGYFDFPTRILSLTRHYPLAGELLANFLISEKGNAKLNTPDTKIIAHRGKRYAQAANLTHNRKNVRYRELLETLEKVEIIEKIEPPIEELKRIKPAKGLETIIYVHVKSSIEELDNLIASKIKEKSNL